MNHDESGSDTFPQLPASTTLSVSQSVALAVELHQRGRLEEAAELYTSVLQIAPANVDALHFLGILNHQQGRSEAAVDLIRRAILIDPEYIDAHLNLGNVLKEQGQLVEAEAAYREVIARNPRHAGVFNNLGTVLRQQKKYDEAIATLEHAISLRPRDADAYHNLGNALKEHNRLEDALTAYRMAIEIKPDHTDAHLNLGRALYRFGRVDEAEIVFRKWLEVEPQNPVAAHMLAACTGKNPPQRASSGFIQETFDRFAASFDAVLNRLDYRAPDLVAAALKHADPEAAGQLNILDAGCGTGLCAHFLRPYARQLVGVDLSPKMLEKASGLETYHALIEADLIEHIEQSTGRYDAIVSADTLVYFGALESVLQAAATALRPGGVLIFTVEHGPDEIGQIGYRLNPHGRYSHTQRYIEQTLREAGLSLQKISSDTLRQEVFKPVPGLIVTALKEATDASDK